MNKVRGTRDIIPFSHYITLYEIIRSHLLLHNFQEIHTPSFEYEELFTKNLGTATDIVNKEMYYVSHIHQDPADQKMVLRPEMTASIMRAFLEEKIQDAPWQVFEFGSTFRHERPQKGRYREFLQCSIECINAKQIGYDISLLAMLNTLFKNIIGDTFQLHINYIGLPEERTLYRSALYAYCLSHKLSFPEIIQQKLSEETILRILDSKDATVQHILEKAPRISDFWNENNKNEWHTICQQLTDLHIPFIHNEKLIRGLDYYNGLLFEFISHDLGAQNTFCGGGRYDTLAQNIDEKKNIPALGAGIGIDRLLLIKEEQEKQYPTKKKNIPSIAIIMDESNEQSLIAYAITIQNTLIANAIQTEIYFNKESFKSGLKKANNNNVLFCALIDNEQMKKNTIIIKQMTALKEQKELTLPQAISYIVTNIPCDH